MTGFQAPNYTQVPNWPFPEEDVDMWGNPIKWQHCIHCAGMVFTILPTEEAYCGQCQEPKTPNKPSKKSIPKKFRMKVFERDNFTCKYCGSRENLSVDHIIPESKGGLLTMENTQTLCKTCNLRKGNR
jgi:hypothetical protein